MAKEKPDKPVSDVSGVSEAAPGAVVADPLEEKLSAEFEAPPDLQALPEGGAEIPEGDELPGSGLIDAGTIGMILALPFDFMAARQGEHWRLSADEKKMIAPVAARVANKWVPAALAKFTDEIALISVLVMIVGKRARIDAEKAKPAAPSS